MRLRILPLVLALSACSLTPALIKPALPVPAAFRQSRALKHKRMRPIWAGARCLATAACSG